MLHYDNMSIEIPEWDGVRRKVAALWRMQKNAHVAICSLWVNPEGAELRLTVDGKVQLTDVSHHLFAPSSRSRRRSGITGSRDGGSHPSELRQQ
jgi:hypothetical protein